MRLQQQLLKTIISNIDLNCDTKQDVLRMLKEELISLELEKTLNLFNPDDNKERNFHLSLASQEEFWNNALRKEEQLGIDIYAYKQQVEIWSDTLSNKDKRKKRTPRGWIATARQFMSSDKEKGKLLMTIKEQEKTNKKVIDYLNLE